MKQNEILSVIFETKLNLNIETEKSMKPRNILLLSFAIILLATCNKNAEEPYSVDNILTDNALAAIYFHTIFREAENTWVLVDSIIKYKTETYEIPANRPASKTLTYNADTDTVTVKYNEWPSGGHLLSGTMYVTFIKNAYCTVDGAKADIKLNDFSINGQMVTADSRITYKKVNNSKTDHFTYTLLDGAAIREKGTSMPVIITGTISNGQYNRIEGGETLTQEDDVWEYSGRMTGTLGKGLSMKYTNEVQSSFQGENGTVHFTTDCKFAEQGIAKITITGRPDIFYGYYCSGVYYETVTHVD